MSAKRTWAIWIPTTFTVVDQLSHQTAEITADAQRGRVYQRVALLGDLTRSEAEAIARQRHGDDAIITRHRSRNAPDRLYERDLRMPANRTR